ncbi:hypothetical protein HDIA_3465 [Hartmannibacter diazotrophicus]|uniref:Uncharacterized protein n=1 Tax=Hartmannibacter diazotrophicus TaxID=1482074 RepID=A0A2C9D9Q5_9HYPH|nr:hypothetical protein [Hartmannibacter diazotrophicus]SON57006.1 hypothetical protein HDIA_3465 [Hartmannibacter diazotrophicus]
MGYSKTYSNLQPLTLTAPVAPRCIVGSSCHTLHLARLAALLLFITVMTATSMALANPSMKDLRSPQTEAGLSGTYDSIWFPVQMSKDTSRYLQPQQQSADAGSIAGAETAALSYDLRQTFFEAALGQHSNSSFYIAAILGALLAATLALSALLWNELADRLGLSRVEAAPPRRRTAFSS